MAVSNALNHSPAEVLLQYLIDIQALTDGLAAWPGYHSKMPNSPDSAVCLYDSDGGTDKRLHVSGFTLDHPMVQLRVRGATHIIAKRKVGELVALLDLVPARHQVTLDGTVYTLHSINRRNAGAALPPEAELDRRSFTINVQCTITQERPTISPVTTTTSTTTSTSTTTTS